MTQDQEKRAKLWKTFSNMETHIMDLYTADKFLEHSLGYIESLEVDKAMNTIISVRQYLDVLQGRMDDALNEMWSLTKEHD